MPIRQNVAGNVLTTTGITTDTVVLVTVTNANGCSDTASLTVLVPYVVTPGNITAPGDTNICPKKINLKLLVLRWVLRQELLQLQL